ncbi:MAG: hypothetical protein CSYNP_02063 [Syntrophus sp. SKADARSKE-3]|nr:hypothetical protein [Syntrophus sp. SKADARSKE-3]
MNRLAKVVAIIAASAIVLGCGAIAREIQKKTVSSRDNIFSEIKQREPLPKDSSRLTIKANIKTHLEGYYWGESKGSHHGKANYPFVVNIDGQAVVWYVDGFRDSMPKYDKDGETSHNPEAGEGIKYVLEKNIKLPAGNHRIFLGFPDDDYYVEVQISLKEGESSVLEFKPIYKYKTDPHLIQTFLNGINKYEVYFNGSIVTEGVQKRN